MNIEKNKIITQFNISEGWYVSKYFKIIVPSVVILSLLFTKGDILFFSLTEALCASFAAGVPIITFLRKDEKEEMFYKYVGIGFLFISLLTFAKAIILSEIAVYLEYNIINMLNLITFYLEYIVILLAFYLKLKKRSLKTSIYINLFISIIFLGIGIGIYNNIITNTIILNSEYQLAILALLTIIMVAYKGKNIIGKDERKIIFRYIIFIVLHQSFYVLYVNLNVNWIYLAGVFKYLAYYTVYEIILKYVLYNSYSRVKKDLESSKKVEEELNTILKGRNRTLVEMENIIDKRGKRYGQLIDSISDGIIIFYFDKIYYVNKEALNLIGFNDYTDLINMKFNFFVEHILSKQVTLDNVKDISLLIKKVQSGDEKEIKIDISSNDGSQYEMYIMNIDNLNRFIYIKNVTEMNKNHEFKLRYKEFLKSEDLKTEFYANISHELRTPINLIYSAIQLTQININDNNMESIQKSNEIIKHNCLRLIRTINNFIDTNRVSEGYLVPNCKIYNIISIVENIALTSNKYIEQIDNTLMFDSEEEEVYAECDKEIMERVILNILSNSVKFGKRGGKIDINISSESDIITIVIKNNSYIIDEKSKLFLFDKFTKINRSLNRKEEGSGLGLYLTKELLLLQKGTITLESDVSSGTKFIITLHRSHDSKHFELEEDFEMNPVENVVDIEFSDIYL
ncbi:sensor histidine kinase [Clostridium vincentii]|uniref:histidine kinase n=1 Tax=Clostridium vincentii TaxID=52704 RepID=A0A2T0BHR4_9CLOT|nr:HAMP domain-containing sensor histidine kinase [Clostridium vincentii]PRR83436.1 Sensor histidine kinase TmoS [Clostridium vincentii]